MPSWLKRLFRRPSPPPLIIGSWSGYTLSHWSASPPHIRFAQNLFREPMFRDLLAVLANTRPHTPARGLSDTDASVQLGIRMGHDQFMGILMQLPAFPTEPPAEVPADYGATGFDINTTP